MGTLKVNKATLKDLNKVVKYYIEFREDQTRFDKFYIVPPRGFVEGYLKRRLMDKDSLVAVLKIDDQIVGMCIAWIDVFKTAYFGMKKRGFIESIFIDRRYRRRGFATELFKYALNWIKSKNINYVTLDVFPRNTEVISFWEKLGFRTYLSSMRRRVS